MSGQWWEKIKPVHGLPADLSSRTHHYLYPSSPARRRRDVTIATVSFLVSFAVTFVAGRVLGW